MTNHMTSLSMSPGSNLALSDWQQMDSLEQLRTPSSDDDEEFFDAHGTSHDCHMNNCGVIIQGQRSKQQQIQNDNKPKFASMAHAVGK